MADRQGTFEPKTKDSETETVAPAERARRKALKARGVDWCKFCNGPVQPPEDGKHRCQVCRREKA